MADHTQNAKLRAEARFAETQRRTTANEKVVLEHQKDIQAVRDKTARLRALRLQKEVAEPSGPSAPSRPTRRKA